jgi:hypothetical protein
VELDDGKNLLWVAENRGHSAAVMLKTYVKGLKGSAPQEVAAIEQAMGFATDTPLETAVRRNNLTRN